MAINYVKMLPRDKGSETLQEFPAPFRPNARYASENSSASSVISVSHDTTSLEIAAVGGPAAMRWVATTDTEASIISAASGANFDHIVPTGTVRRFALPIESMPATGYGSVVGANRLNGLFQRVAIKSIGVASVLVVEF